MRWMLIALFFVGCAAEPDTALAPENEQSRAAALLRDQAIAGDAAARQNAVDQLSTMGDYGVVSGVQLFDHADIGVKTSGLQVLRRIADAHPHVLARLEQGLAHANPRVRSESAAAAAAIGEPAANLIPALVPALADDDWEVRYHASRALGTTGWRTYEFEGTLMATARHDLDRRVREAASASHEAVRVAWIEHQKTLPRTH